MAWDANHNLVYAQRMEAIAKAFQDLAEEAARLRTVYTQVLQANPATFVDTPIALKSEITTAQSYLTEFLTFHNGGATLTNTARGTAWLLPLIDTTPAG